MVVRREVIREVGGIEQLGWHIADDIQLARMIRQHGYRIHLLRQPARVIHHHDSFTGWWSHRHRWLVIIRHYWPVNYALMNLVDPALSWSVVYLGIALSRGSGVIALGPLLVALTTALVSAAVVNTVLARNEKLWRFLWVVLVQELFRLPLVLHSLATDEIVWRGRRFRVHSDGTASIAEPRAVGHGTA